MERFSRSEFERLSSVERDHLSRELETVLMQRLRSGNEFHSSAYGLIDELRALGHDLWSYDESDDLQAWGPNYVACSGPGIVIELRPDTVRVEWSDG